VITRLNDALRVALATREVREKFEAQAFVPFATTPGEAGKFIASEAQRLSRVIKTKGITAN
jgi:tripartite-type tricarboxylate transporter receptor subunit TctC